MDAVNGLSFFCSSETVVKNPAPLIFKSSHLNKWKKKKVGGAANQRFIWKMAVKDR